MSAIHFIEVVSVLNFILISGLIFYTLRGKSLAEILGINVTNLSEETFSENRISNTYEEKMAVPETFLRNEPELKIEFPSKPNQVNPGKLAISRLKLGEDPELVARELGYSRSEIGILQAASKR
jgi:hypothetical protein